MIEVTTGADGVPITEQQQESLKDGQQASSIVGKTTNAQTSAHGPIIPRSMQQARTRGGKGGKVIQSNAHLTATQTRKAFRGFKHMTNAEVSTAITPGERKKLIGKDGMDSTKFTESRMANIKLEDSSMGLKPDVSEDSAPKGIGMPGDSSIADQTSAHFNQTAAAEYPGSAATRARVPKLNTKLTKKATNP